MQHHFSTINLKLVRTPPQFSGFLSWLGTELKILASVSFEINWDMEQHKFVSSDPILKYLFMFVVERIKLKCQCCSYFLERKLNSKSFGIITWKSGSEPSTTL